MIHNCLAIVFGQIESQNRGKKIFINKEQGPGSSCIKEERILSMVIGNNTAVHCIRINLQKINPLFV